MANPGFYVAMAREQKLKLPELFSRLSPEAAKGYPEDAFSDILAREELEIHGNVHSESATVDEWLDSTDKDVGPKETLFWEQLDRDYDQGNTIHELDMRQKATTTTVTQIGENTALNPRAYRALYERNKRRPALGIADIATGIETINTRNFGEPQYTTPDADHRSSVVGEGMPLPVTTLSTGERTRKMKKIGGGLRVSLEYEMDATRMSSVRFWVGKMALSDEIRMVNEGINVLRGSAAGVAIGATPDFDSILQVQTHFSTNCAYQIDLLIARKADARKWIKAHQTAGSTASEVFNRVVPSGRFGGV